MTKYFYVALVLLLAGCAPSFISIKPKTISENSIACYKVFAHGMMSKSNYAYMILKNVEDGTEFTSGFKGKYNFISDIRPGKYLIERMELQFANMKVIAKNYRDTLTIPPGKIIFLGSYDIYFKPGTDIRKFKYEEISDQSLIEIKNIMMEYNYGEEIISDDSKIITKLFESRNAS